MANERNTKRYSADERKAYYIGVGACLGNRKQIGRVMKQMPEDIKKSFGNGFDDCLSRKFKNKEKGRKRK